MPDIDKMSLKELRAMLKEKRKTAILPVSKMKKGALMRELVTPSNLLAIGDKFEDAPDVYSKKTANQIAEKSQKDKQYVPLEGYHYGAEEIDRPGAKRFARATGKVSESKGGFIGKAEGSERLYSEGKIVSEKRKSSKTYADLQGNQSIPQPEPVEVGKKKVAKSNEDVMVIKRKPGRPPKNAGHRIGSGQAVPSALAPPHLVMPQRETYEQQQMKPNLMPLQKPMKYGGGFVEIIEPPVGKVAKAVAKVEEKIEEKKKRKNPWEGITQEQHDARVAKMQAARGKKKDNK